MPDRSCKRCSVTRVNALVAEYRKAHQNDGDPAKLRQIAAAVRGQYPAAAEMLQPGLADQDLRALCWNVSSFLSDADLERILGLKLKGPGAR